MGLFSILPENLSRLETWVIRIFLFLAALAVAPWLLLLIYDILLYAWRATIFELPYLGGKARGHRKPRAPNLTSRPDGHRRGISFVGLGSGRVDASATTATCLGSEKPDGEVALRRERGLSEGLDSGR